MTPEKTAPPVGRAPWQPGGQGTTHPLDARPVSDPRPPAHDHADPAPRRADHRSLLSHTHTHAPAWTCACARRSLRLWTQSHPAGTSRFAPAHMADDDKPVTTRCMRSVPARCVSSSHARRSSPKCCVHLSNCQHTHDVMSGKKMELDRVRSCRSFAPVACRCRGKSLVCKNTRPGDSFLLSADHVRRATGCAWPVPGRGSKCITVAGRHCGRRHSFSVELKTIMAAEVGDCKPIFISNPAGL